MLGDMDMAQSGVGESLLVVNFNQDTFVTVYFIACNIFLRIFR